MKRGLLGKFMPVKRTTFVIGADRTVLEVISSEFSMDAHADRALEVLRGTGVTPVLDIRDVTFRRNGKQIIDGISLTVQAGEHWALLGPNGAGKSTLLGFCAAVSFPSSGTVHILGAQMGRTDLTVLRRAIGHVNPRHRLQYPLPVREVVLPVSPPHRHRGPLAPSPSSPPRRRADRHRRVVARADSVWPTLSQGERGRT